jgi:hypothetical protein
MSKFDATLEAVTIQLAFFISSIFGAWIILRVLKGTAVVKNRDTQFRGAAAMFVAMFFLLNAYVPGIRDGILAETGGSQTISAQKGTSAINVAISPGDQRVSRAELNRLDKNKYVVDRELGVALLQPPYDMSTGRVQSFETITLGDLPAMQIVVAAYKPFVTAGLKPYPIFAIREQKFHTVVLNADSEIRGTRMDMNPFSDKDLLSRLFEAQRNESIALAATTPEQADTFSANLSDGFDKRLKTRFPITKKIQNGVYVATFELTKPREDNWFETLRKGSTSLDRAYQALTLDYVQTGALRNLKMDQARGIASFEASHHLRKVIVDGAETDATLNVLGFMVAVEERVVFVQLQYLYTGGAFSSLLFLKYAVDNLYFVM